MKNRISEILYRLISQYCYKTGLVLHAFDPKDPADVALLDERIAQAIEPLANKNKELLGEVKKLKKGAEVDPAVVEQLEAKVEKLEGDLVTANKAAKDATKLAETQAAQLADESGFTQKLLIDNGLTAELVANGVKDPALLKASIAMLRSGVTIKADGKERTAMVGDKALAAHVKEWSQSDEGKAFVSAKANTGGGAGGSKNKAGEPIDINLSPVERMHQAREAAAAKT